MDIFKVLGTNIRLVREKMGYSQNKLAIKAGVSQNTISRIERFEGCPTLGTIDWIAGALGVNVLELLQEKRPTSGNDAE